MSIENQAPLKGVRVLELARVLAGPWAGQTLADLGADVIKVENPNGGDDTRKWGPPYFEGEDGTNLSAAYFHSTNRGKRSITADLKTDEGRKLVLRLVKKSDVLVENFKTGGLAKYGLDYEQLKKVNPRLVYCSITGFGHTGPYANFAGYDFIIQGMGGLMSISGEPEGAPVKSGIAISDIVTGLYSVTAIQAALYHALKTGEGQHIDMSLLDSQVAILSNQNLNYFATGKNPKRMGNAHINIMPYDVFPTKDGHIIIAVGNDGQFSRLCTILELENLPKDDKFSKNESRVKNRVLLRKLLIEATTRISSSDLLSVCEKNAVPVGPVNQIDQMFDDPQVIARGLKMEMQDKDGNTLPTVRSPISMSKTPLHYNKPPPRLGEHNEEVLQELIKLEK